MKILAFLLCLMVLSVILSAGAKLGGPEDRIGDGRGDQR